MGKATILRWWKYKSFWKLFGFAIGAIILSLISALLIPEPWCLFAILPLCGVAGFFMKKIIPDVFKDLITEMEKGQNKKE